MGVKYHRHNHYLRLHHNSQSFFFQLLKIELYGAVSVPKIFVSNESRTCTEIFRRSLEHALKEIQMNSSTEYNSVQFSYISTRFYHLLSFMAKTIIPHCTRLAKKTAANIFVWQSMSTVIQTIMGFHYADAILMWSIVWVILNSKTSMLDLRLYQQERLMDWSILLERENSYGFLCGLVLQATDQ